MRCTLLFLFILLANRLLADNVTAEQAHALATVSLKRMFKPVVLLRLHSYN